MKLKLSFILLSVTLLLSTLEGCKTKTKALAPGEGYIDVTGGMTIQRKQSPE